MAIIRKEEQNKWIAGGVLIALAAFLLYRAFFNGSAPAPTPPRQAPPVRSAALSVFENPQQGTRATGGRGALAVRARRLAQAPPGGVPDPKLRLDLLAKAESLSYQGSGRNIFQYYTPPPPPPPKPVKNPLTGDGGAGAANSAGPAAPPPPPPIPLKYYGYAHKPAETQKKAFFVEGDEIFIAGEGEVVNKRYKILKIGVNTVEAEDLVTKHRQILPLQENP